MVSLTHKVKVKFLPATGGMNVAYYAPLMSATLISMGHLQASGAVWGCDPARPRTHILIHRFPGGPLIGSACRTSSNMYPADIPGLTRAHSEAEYCGIAVARSPPPGLSPSSIQSHNVNRARHVNAEQLRRCEEAERLHFLYGHPSDQSLAEMLASGKIEPPTTITGHDLRLLRELKGACPHCLAGKMKRGTHPPSVTAPAQAPGDVVSFDPHLLPCKAPGGYTHEVSYVDEQSGYQIVAGAKSKSVADLAATTLNVMASNFNANRHRISTLHGDSENVNRALRPHVGLVGINVATSGPGEHAHRAERYYQDILAHSAATMSAKPYFLPSAYDHELHKDSADVRNHIINSRSRPFTPEEVFTGRRSSLAMTFGTCAMVTEFEDKRTTEALANGTTAAGLAKAELGVYMGMDRISGLPRFLLANGLIVPRKVYSTLVSHYVPFGWTPKPVINVPFPPFALHTLSTDAASVNAVIQVPDASTGAAAVTTLFRDRPELPPSPPVMRVSVTPPVPGPALQPTETSSTVVSPLLPLPTPLAPAPDLFAAPSTTAPVPPVAIGSPMLQRQPPLVVAASPVPQRQPSLVATASPMPQRQSARIASTPALQQRYTNLANPKFKAFVAAQRPAAAQCSSAAQRPAVLRKAWMQRMANERNKAFRANHSSGITNRATNIRPQPIPAVHAEMNARRAQQVFTPEEFKVANEKELTKMFEEHHTLKTITRRDIEHDAIYLPLVPVFKYKHDGRRTARYAANGKHQPPDSYGATYAGMSDSSNRIAALALNIAFIVTNDKVHKMILWRADVPAAFLQSRLPRSATGGKMLYTRMPSFLPEKTTLGSGAPGPLPNSLAEFIGNCYGIKNANYIFDQSFIKLLLDLGYRQHPLDSYLFRKQCPVDPTDFSEVSTHVDDLSGCCTSVVLYEELERALRKRFGDEMQFHTDGSGICGQEQVRTPTYVKVHMGTYLRAACSAAGYDKLPGALTPSILTPGGLFGPSTGPPLCPERAAEFASANGKLIHALPVRHDIQMVVKHLCKKTKNPTVGDDLKQQQLYRFIKAHPDLGPCFSLRKEDYPDGVVIHGSSDASHATHTENGHGHSAHTISVGRNNGVMVAYSGEESTTVPLSPHQSEYMSLGRLARAMLYWRQFAAGLGYPQPEPLKLHSDSTTAMALTTAPAISRNSRHIAQYAHLLRHLYKTGEMVPAYLGTHEIIPNGLTKTLGPTDYIYHEHQLFGAFRS